MIIVLISIFTLAIIIGLIGLFWLHNADKEAELDVNKLHHNDYIGEKL